jgi:hypothetical protein
VSRNLLFSLYVHSSHYILQGQFKWNYCHKMFHKWFEFESICLQMMIILHTKFQMPSSSGSLVIAVTLKAKYRYAAAILLFYFCKNISLTNIAYFQVLLPNRISGPLYQIVLLSHLTSFCICHVVINCTKSKRISLKWPTVA